MTTPKTTKTEQVKQHLIRKGAISSLEAINLYGATRLAAIIFTLKKKGMSIQTDLRKANDINGNPCTYAVYKYFS